MLVVILVQKPAGLRVVWGINVDALNLLPVLLRKQVHRLPVFAVHQQAVGLLVQIVKARQQAVREVRVEKRRVSSTSVGWALRNSMRRFLPLPLNRLVSFVNIKQRFPLLPLRLVGGDLRVKRLRDVAHGDAVEGLGDEFAFLPEHLLEVFDLRQEGDDVVAHPDQAHHLEPALGSPSPAASISSRLSTSFFR